VLVYVLMVGLVFYYVVGVVVDFMLVLINPINLDLTLVLDMDPCHLGRFSILSGMILGFKS